MLLSLTLPAWAETTNQAGRIALVAAIQSAGGAPVVQAGLSFHLNPGWKIYWRTPGDAGYPPALTWDRSRNIGNPVLSWPAPHRNVEAGLQSIGYTGDVIFPLTIPVPHPGQPVHLDVDVDYLACEKICVPLNAALMLDLPAGDAQPSPHAHLLAQASAQIPGDPARMGWRIHPAHMIDGALVVEVDSDTPLSHPDLLVEDQAQTSPARPDVRMDGPHVTFTIPAAPANWAGQSLTLTLVDDDRSAQFSATPTLSSAHPVGSLGLMALVALAGGFILNLMPCVLPILSLKILALLSHSGGQRRRARAGFLASSAGILTSFLGLAVTLIALRQAGHAVGWGLQFQQPVFLILMIALLSIFAANLWDLFHIPLPGWVGGLGTGQDSLSSHFLTGLCATLLATPCSAPFVGTAIGFALARGPMEILTVFLSLGLGMAAPFLAVAAWPQLAVRLPHPGPWMNSLRRIMGTCLGGTALWLMVVLWGTIHPTAPAAKTGNVNWQSFDAARLQAELAQGHVVLVDVTADWCLTCKVNKLTVVEHGAVADYLNQPGVVALQADWTQPSDIISRYLESFGRFGIPFDAVYGPNAPQGLALPELLTEADVLTALRAAKPTP